MSIPIYLNNGKKTFYIGCNVGDIPTIVPPHIVSLHSGLDWNNRQGSNIYNIKPIAPGEQQSAINSFLAIKFYFGLNSTSVDPLWLPVTEQPGTILTIACKPVRCWLAKPPPLGLFALILEILICFLKI